MKLFKRTLTTAVAVCLALQSAVVCFGAEAEEQIPAGGEEVGLYTSENDEAIQLTEICIAVGMKAIRRMTARKRRFMAIHLWTATTITGSLRTRTMLLLMRTT